MGEIGRLRYVDLREVWPDEARSFTPWLRDNADVLGDLLGMELEFTAEHSVGKFSLDLFGHEVGTGQRVIVENQLAKSDHTHLGQLLTYAGGTDPSHVVWIAKEIRDEHRAALEWLNHRTDSNTMFFGLELKAIRIGDSPAAPILDLVVEPNQWAKGTLKAIKETELSTKARGYQAFWSELLELLKGEIRELESKNAALPQSWLDTSVGFTGINLNLVFPKNALRVELYLGSSDTDLNLARFEALSENRDLIFGSSNLNFEFEELPGKKAKRIAVYAPFENASVSNSEEHEAYKKWFLEVYGEFRGLVTGKSFVDLISNV
jgi:hypothetical protein